jgi:hypothetical protein
MCWHIIAITFHIHSQRKHDTAFSWNPMHSALPYVACWIISHHRSKCCGYDTHRKCPPLYCTKLIHTQEKISTALLYCTRISLDNILFCFSYWPSCRCPTTSGQPSKNDSTAYTVQLAGRFNFGLTARASCRSLCDCKNIHGVGCDRQPEFLFKKKDQALPVCNSDRQYLHNKSFPKLATKNRTLGWRHTEISHDHFYHRLNESAYDLDQIRPVTSLHVSIIVYRREQQCFTALNKLLRVLALPWAVTRHKNT